MVSGQANKNWRKGVCLIIYAFGNFAMFWLEKPCHVRNCDIFWKDNIKGLGKWGL